MTRLQFLDKNRRDAASRPRRAGFFRAEDGSLIVFGLLIFILMLTAGGMAVDFMRFEAHRARLQSTLDRAVLAAASLDQSLDPASVVLDYFDKAGLGGTISTDDITVTESLTSRNVSATADLTMSATLLRLSGITELTAPAAGAAEESASQTEISLVLDVSGSMGWSSSSGASKISELRTAAKKFVNMVLCNPADPDATSNCVVEDGKVSVNIVPYSEQVNAGGTLLAAFNPTSEHSYSNCVTFAAEDFGTSALTTTQQLQRTGHFDPWSSSSRDAGYNHGWTCSPYSDREITPVGSNPSILRSRIDDLEAYGNTSIDIGMKWGAALLDPAAQPAVTSLVDSGDIDGLYANRPLAWTERGVEKVIVLMTDGVNTYQHYLYDGYRDGLSPVWRTVDEVSSGYSGSDYIYSIYRESTGLYYWPHSGEWKDHAYGTAASYEECAWVRRGWRWYSYWEYQCSTVSEAGNGAVQMTYPQLWNVKPWDWYDQFSWLSTPGSYYNNSTKNARLASMCAAAKEAGITIFTIGFEVTSDSANVMRNCASTPAKYFDVDGLDLTAAFAAIALEINKLRLVN